ncbi:heavy-metal-associated domain-containing protein [Nostoc ellipsosporum NOK]|jgi:copper chaperone CopZ|nr:heavy-metal-associated domain-containing protein [Nostoc ellipsosporum NOK]
MKKLLFIAMVLFMGMSVQAQFSRAELQATGLTCAMCSNAINKALQQLPFVENVKVDIKSSIYKISFREGAAVSIDGLKDAVEDAGFSVGDLKLSGRFENVSVANDKHVQIGNETFHFLDIKDQVLNGEKTITVVDKHFVSPKKFKKISNATRMACVHTGKAGSCCTRDGVKADTRIYHVTI